MTLRDYQEAAGDAVLREWEDNQSTLVVMPTGSGKTILFADIIRRRFPRRAMVIAHREELIFQAREKIQRATGLHCEIEMGDCRADLSAHLNGSSPRVVISTVQTLTAGGDGTGRLNKFDPALFGTLIADESHHATSKSWSRVLQWFRRNPELRVLGVTATPDRADEAALGREFETVAFDYEISDAIRDGWLVPIKQQMVYVADLDYSSIRTTAGDLNGADLAEVLENEEILHRMASPAIEILGNKRAIAFTESVKQAQRLAEIFNRHRDGMASWVCGTTPKDERRELKKDFAAGKVQVVANCGVWTEGFDDAGVEAILMGRPTKSRALYAQMCLDIHTEILTDHGWRGIDDEIVAVERAAAFKADGTIEFQKITNIVRRTLLQGESFVEINNPHISIRITNQHDFVVSTKHGRRQKPSAWRKVTADEALKTNRMSIPVAGMESRSGVNLKDDELRFIGLVITDGNINPANGQITLYQSERYPWIIEYIEQVLWGCRFKFGHRVETLPTNFGKRSPLHRWTISHGMPRGRDRHLRGWEALAGYLDKDWPDAFENLTRQQLVVVLEAMHAGDGRKNAKTDYTPRTNAICTANTFLANRIQSLCVRRGIRCNIGVAGTTGSGMVMLNYSLARNTWTLPIKASDGRPVLHRTLSHGEPVWCITVDSGMIVTRRFGKVAILGNCGRSTRPVDGLVDQFDDAESRRTAIAESTKPHCLIVDFVGNSGRHKLMSCADILGGKYEDDVVEAAAKKARLSGKPVQMDETLEEAKEEKRQRQLAEEAQRKRLVIHTKWTAHEIDPFDAFGIEPYRERGWDGGKTLTPRQRGLLEKHGVDHTKLTYHQSRRVIGEMVRRWNRGLCSYKQAKLLTKFGYDASNMTRDQAKSFIDKIAANGWKKPNESMDKSHTPEPVLRVPQTGLVHG